jgi:hypothetical protein
VAAVEAFVNESLLGQFAKIQCKESGLWNISDDTIDRFDIRTKLIIVPMLLFGNTFSRDAQPFQDFATLVRIRNDGIHFKMQLHAPKYVRDLSQRDIAITYDGIKENVADYDWPSKLSTTSGILWAHNTSCRVVQELVGFMSDEISNLCLTTILKSGIQQDFLTLMSTRNRFILLAIISANQADPVDGDTACRP